MAGFEPRLIPDGLHPAIKPPGHRIIMQVLIAPHLCEEIVRLTPSRNCSPP